MNREEILERLASHRKDVEAFGVKSLALFGSVARGEARSESDLDLLVDFEGPATFDQFMELKFFLEELLECQVDLVTRKALKPRLQQYVEKEALYVT